METWFKRHLSFTLLVTDVMLQYKFDIKNKDGSKETKKSNYVSLTLPGIAVEQFFEGTVSETQLY